MRLIKGIHHISLKCGSTEEYNRVIGFYRDVLGMEAIRTWGSGSGAGTMLRCGSSIVEICAEGKASDKTGALNHIAFAADDVDACAAAVTAAGCRITLEPVSVTIQSQPTYSVRVAFCIGPVGEEIEFFQE